MIKKFYLSKTFWVNILACAGLIGQSVMADGFVIAPEFQAMILTVVNMVLRFITKEELVWK